MDYLSEKVLFSLFFVRHRGSSVRKIEFCGRMSPQLRNIYFYPAVLIKGRKSDSMMWFLKLFVFMGSFFHEDCMSLKGNSEHLYVL